MIKNVIFLLIILFSVNNLFARHENIDSLIESGSFVLAEEKLELFDTEGKIELKIKLLLGLKQYKKALKFLNDNRSELKSYNYLLLHSRIELVSGSFKNTLSQLNQELRDSSSIQDGYLLFEIAKHYNRIDSLSEAKISIVKSIKLLSSIQNDTTKLDQLILFADILSNAEKKMEAIQIIHSAQVLSQSNETSLSDLKRKQYKVLTDIKRGILYRKLGEINKSLEALQTAEFAIHSVDELWALNLKTELYKAFQVTLFISGNKDKLFAYNIKASLNQAIISDQLFEYFDERHEVQSISNQPIDQKTKTAPIINNSIEVDWLWLSLIGLLVIFIALLAIIITRKNGLIIQTKQEIEDVSKAFLLYQSEVLSKSSSEGKKIIQEIAMMSNRQSKWSKSLNTIVFNSKKSKKQEIVDSIESLSQEMIEDIKVDTKKTQLNDNVRKVSKDFKERLRIRYPQLIRTEVELCSLIRLRMSNKEIADIRNISISSARTARYRLKKKLNIPENLDIEQVLAAI